MGTTNGNAYGILDSTKGNEIGECHEKVVACKRWACGDACRPRDRGRHAGGQQAACARLPLPLGHRWSYEGNRSRSPRRGRPKNSTRPILADRHKEAPTVEKLTPTIPQKCRL